MKLILCCAAAAALIPMAALTAARAESPKLIVAAADAHQETLVVRTEAARYSILAPRGWTAKAEPNGTVLRLHSPDLASYIAIRFGSEREGTPPGLAERQQELRGTYAEAEIADAFTFEFEGRSATSVDLTWTGKNVLSRSARVVTLPVAEGWVEVSLHGPADQFETLLPLFMQTAGSLQTGAPDRTLQVRRHSRE